MQKKNRNGMLKHCFMIAAVLAAFLFAAGCNPPTGNDGKTGNEGKNGTEKEGGTTTPGGETSGGEQPGGEQPGGEQPGEEEGQGNGGGPITPPAVDETEVKLTLKDVGTGAGLSGFAAVGSLGTENYATGVPVKAKVETSKLGNAAEVGAKLKAAVTAKIAALKTANAGFDFKVFKNADGTGGEATADADFVKDQDLFIGKKAAAAGNVTPKITLAALPVGKEYYVATTGANEGVGYEFFTDGAKLKAHPYSSEVASAQVPAKLKELVETALGGASKIGEGKDYIVFKRAASADTYTVVDLGALTAADQDTTLYVGKQMPKITLKVQKTSQDKNAWTATGINSTTVGTAYDSAADLIVYVPATKKASFNSDLLDAVDLGVNKALASKLNGKTAKLFTNDTASNEDRPGNDQILKSSPPNDTCYIAFK